MRISCICFTEKGAQTALMIRHALNDASTDIDVWTERKSKTADEEVHVVSKNIHAWVADHFLTDDAIIFVGAVGIAVRLIAPQIQSKTTDPAIVVVDEEGRWAISLLSVHLGRANDLARRTAAGIGAEAIVTTAADLHAAFAVDVFARENNCVIGSMELAKEVSSAVLGGRPVGFYADPLLPVDGTCPEELTCYPPGTEPYTEEGCEDRPVLGITMSLNSQVPYFQSNLSLVPKAVVLGVDCRRGVAAEELERFLFNFLDVSGVSLEAVCKVASVDLKVQEPAIHSFCEKHQLPFETYTASQLIRVPGRFSASSFVEKTIGVDNVCERAAVLGAMDRELPGKLIVEKKAYNGMTAALALVPRLYHWKSSVFQTR